VVQVIQNNLQKSCKLIALKKSILNNMDIL
jgi:hypothetical protein